MGMLKITRRKIPGNVSIVYRIILPPSKEKSKQ